jgi:hypothetical protein
MKKSTAVHLYARECLIADASAGLRLPRDPPARDDEALNGTDFTGEQGAIAFQKEA